MPSDAEVVEVLARAITDARGQDPKAYVGRMTILECNLPDARRLAAALRSAGYAVVMVGELEALVEASRLARDALDKISTDSDWEPPHPRGTMLDAALIPFTKDPTNAQ